MKEFWNTKFSQSEYVYGQKPNKFFKEKITDLPKGSILFSAEGEGRNAVYAAEKGWQVTAFDISEKGKDKAMNLAERKGVLIRYDVHSILDIIYPEESFNAIGIFFMHLPSEIKKRAFQHLFKRLKKGGAVILEVFSEKQLAYNSGGPKSLDLLYTPTELKEIFKSFSSVDFIENEVVLDEGPLHQGMAATIRIFAIK